MRLAPDNGIERIRELEAELTADNELFQQRWREWQAERDALKAALQNLLDDMGEDVRQRHHMDKYRVYQISLGSVDAARLLLTPSETPTTKLTSVSSKSASALETFDDGVSK